MLGAICLHHHHKIKNNHIIALYAMFFEVCSRCALNPIFASQSELCFIQGETCRYCVDNLQEGYTMPQGTSYIKS